MSHDFVKEMMTWGGSSLPLFPCHRGLGGHKSSMASYKTGRVFHMSVESVSTVLTQSYLGVHLLLLIASLTSTVTSEGKRNLPYY